MLCSANDALAMFYGFDLDYLVLQDILVNRDK
jgi:predicted NodU family carbamoyl transferase